MNRLEKLTETCSSETNSEAHARRLEYQRRRRAKNKQWMDSKKSHPCMDCGHSFPPIAMDFDHVRGTKVANISQMLHCARRVIEDEFAKCDLVCSNCHRIRHGSETPPE